MDPMKLMKLKSAADGFKKRHSKFVSFIHAMNRKGLPEGSIIEVRVKQPDGKEYVSNLKVTREDAAFLSNFQ